MKGMFQYVSHIILIGVVIMILITITITMRDFYNMSVEQTQEIEAKIVANNIIDNIIRLHELYGNESITLNENESITMAEIILNVPNKIAGRDYEIELVNSGEFWIECDISTTDAVTIIDIDRPYAYVKITTFRPPTFEKAFKIPNVGIEIGGNARKTNKILLRYIKENSGKIKDKIIMSRYD